tara:strand:+ start:11081 stop:12187 length:1107 start_codon:yes stop_codon:yes gene_type:complete
MNFIDLKKQYEILKKEIDSSIHNVLKDGNFIQGKQVKELEKLLSDYVGAKCVTCANGTDALLVALRALGITRGDEVIVPSFTWVSTAEVVKLVDATPIYADIDEDTFNISLEDIKSKITNKTKAIIPVSMFGRTCDIKKITNFANENGIKVIEDSAQAFGSKNDGNLSCSVAHISTTSFFPAKPLGCYGDGGAIFCTDPKLFETAAAITKHGQQGRYNYVEIGLNSRLDTIQAAVLIEKMKVYEDEIAQRNEVAKKYDESLHKISKIKLPEITDPSNRSVWAQYTILLDKDISQYREKIMGLLKEHEVPTALYYPAPIHLQKPYFSDTKLEVTEDVANRVLSLPMHPYLDTESIEKISNALNNVIESI